METGSDSRPTTWSASPTLPAGSTASAHLFAGLARELSRPLLALREEIACFAADSPRRESAARPLASSCERLLDLTQDFFEFARLSSIDAPSPACQTFSLSAWLSKLDGRYETQALSLGVRWLSELRGEDYLVTTDRQRLDRIADALVRNALNFSRSGGSIRIAIARDSTDFWRLDIEDDGPGIAAEELDNLFQPFRQVHPPGFSRDDGNGLGLALARRLAESLRGEIRLQSDSGLGTRATVRLPLSVRS